VELIDKLKILADAAKYDASCASSGAERRDSSGGKGLGSTDRIGICHAYAPDGRCISLLKLLLTNSCVFDCHYCVNRRSSNTRRARFTVEEVVRLTIGFYKRNYIEGLFLSSGIIRDSDYTMGELVRVARCLREEHGFRGYIHLKAIPDADEALLAEAGRWADRLSLNVELPSEASLKRLAPEKSLPGIRRSMGAIGRRVEQSRADPKAPRFAPAGQSTQLIVGADGTDDRAILGLSTALYESHALRRVYYSAFSPIPEPSPILPLRSPPLVREHRLYQADWLLRHYGFEVGEITTGADGMLDLEADPKLAWALAHRERFPVDVNRASREELLRVPGFGVRTVDRLIASRRFRSVRLLDLSRLRVPLGKVKPFITLEDHRPRALDRADLRERLLGRERQLGLFGHA